MHSTQENMTCFATGSYGCAFRPALLDKTPTRDNNIGKVFEETKEFKEELESLAIIQRIDPFHQFTLPVRATGSFTRKAIPKNVVIDKCKFLLNARPRQRFRQIIMQDGGVTMATLLERPTGLSAVDIRKFLVSFQSIVSTQWTVRPRLGEDRPPMLGLLGSTRRGINTRTSNPKTSSTIYTWTGGP
jgi:hypothetical protein